MKPQMNPKKRVMDPKIRFKRFKTLKMAPKSYWMQFE